MLEISLSVFDFREKWGYFDMEQILFFMDTTSNPKDHHIGGGPAVEMTAKCTEPDDTDHDDVQSLPVSPVKLSPWAFLMRTVRLFDWTS